MEKKSKVRWVYNDGGYEKYRNELPNCPYTRAIAIATGMDYKECYQLINNYIIKDGYDELYVNNCRQEVVKTVIRKVLADLNADNCWRSKFAQGCTKHLKREELPPLGTIIVQISKGLTTLIDGVIQDMYDPSRKGTRCIYNIWTIGAENKIRKA